MDSATATAKDVIDKEIQRFAQMRNDQDQAIELLFEEIGRRDDLRREYAGVVNVLKRSLDL